MSRPPGPQRDIPCPAGHAPAGERCAKRSRDCPARFRAVGLEPPRGGDKRPDLQRGQREWGRLRARRELLRQRVRELTVQQAQALVLSWAAAPDPAAARAAWVAALCGSAPRSLLQVLHTEMPRRLAEALNLSKEGSC